MKLVITRELPVPVPASVLNTFQTIEVYPGDVPPSQEKLREMLSDADAAIILLTERIDCGLLSHCPKLKHIATFSVGVDHVLLSALQSKGIKLSHTPNVLTDATADLSVALGLAAARWLKPAESYLSDEKFFGVGASLFLGLELCSATVGIVGMGRIGQAVARRYQAFGSRILYFDYKNRKFDVGTGASKEKLLAESDLISLHCPLTPETRHWIGASDLKKMKPSAVLVNIARGPVVDEVALESHLQSHPHFRAALDVFEKEPKVSNKLVRLPNAFCVPHIGSATWASRKKMAEICLDEVVRFALGEKLHYEYRF